MQESATYQVILKEGIEQGIETGVMKRDREITLNMLQKRFTIDDIMAVTGLTLKQIQALQAESVV
jgi:predicted transposase/invertase (TIGR01784 family)